MKNYVICDTGVISRYLSRDRKIVAKVNNYIGLDNICINPVIRIEALNWISGYIGLDKFDRTLYVKFIKDIPLLHITQPISQLAIQLAEKDINSRPGDTLIAATAIHHSLSLYTINARHFRNLGVTLFR